MIFNVVKAIFKNEDKNITTVHFVMLFITLGYRFY